MLEFLVRDVQGDDLSSMDSITDIKYQPIICKDSVVFVIHVDKSI